MILFAHGRLPLAACLAGRNLDEPIWVGVMFMSRDPLGHVT